MRWWNVNGAWSRFQTNYPRLKKGSEYLLKVRAATGRANAKKAIRGGGKSLAVICGVCTPDVL